MGMFLNRAEQAAVIAIAILVMGMGRLFTDVARLFLRQTAKAQNLSAVGLVGNGADRVRGVALDGAELCFFRFRFLNQLGNDSHMVGSLIAVKVEENNVAGLGFILPGLFVKPVFLSGQGIDPGGAAAVVGEVGDFRIAQAEGHEHGAPVAVGDAVPLAVTGVALDQAGLIYDEVAGTFTITKLGLRYGQQIRPVIAGEDNAAHGSLPVRRRLQVGRGVAGGQLFIAGVGMDMLRQLTDQLTDRLHRFKAALGVLMGRGLNLAAAEHGPGNNGPIRQRAGKKLQLLIAFGAVLMLLVFLKAADQLTLLQLIAGVGVNVSFFHCCITGVGVDMGSPLRESTDQYAVCVIAVFIMAMYNIVSLTADQIPVRVITGLCMAVNAQSLISTAEHSLRFCRERGVAFIGMGMLLDSADRFLRGDGRQDKGIGGTEYDHAPQNADNFSPETAPPLFGQKNVRFRLYDFLHSESSSLSHNTQPVQRPDTEDDFSHDLLLGHTAHGSISRIHRRGAVVAHDKDLAVRHLIGQLNIAVAQGLFNKVWLVQHCAVDIHGTVPVNVHPVCRTADHALDENLIIIIEGDNIARRKIRGLNAENDLPILQGGGHGAAVDLQHRQPQRCRQYGHGGHDDERIYSASQHGMIPFFILFPGQLRFKLLGGGDIHGGKFLLHCVSSAMRHNTFSF